MSERETAEILLLLAYGNCDEAQVNEIEDWMIRLRDTAMYRLLSFIAQKQFMREEIK